MFKCIALLILLTMNCAHCMKDNPSDPATGAQTSVPLVASKELILHPGDKGPDDASYNPSNYQAFPTEYEYKNKEFGTLSGCIDLLGIDPQKLACIKIGQKRKYFEQDKKYIDKIALFYNDKFIGFDPSNLLYTVERAQVAVFKDYQKNRGRSSLVDLQALAQEIAILAKYRNHWYNHIGSERLFDDPNDIYSVFDAYYRWAILRPEDSDKGIGPFGGKGMPFYGSPLAGVPGQNKFMRHMAFFMDLIQQDALRVITINKENMTRPSGEKKSYPPIFAIRFNEGIITDKASSANVATSTTNQVTMNEMKHQQIASDDETVPPAHKVSFYYEPGSVMEQSIRLQHLINGDKPHQKWTFDDYEQLSKLKPVFTADVWWQFTEALLNKQFNLNQNHDGIQTLLRLSSNIFETFNKTQIPEREAECYLLLAESFEGDKAERANQNMYDYLEISSRLTHAVMSQYVERCMLRCDAQIGVNLFPHEGDSFFVGSDKKQYGGYSMHMIPQSTQALFRKVEDACGKFLPKLEDTSIYFRNREYFRKELNQHLEIIRAFMQRLRIPFITPTTRIPLSVSAATNSGQ